jgi:hypothetical protein
MQPLLALLHELWPLQLFPPMHFTLLWVEELVEELCAKPAPERNIAPTAVAKTAPVIDLRSIALLPLGPCLADDQLVTVYAERAPAKLGDGAAGSWLVRPVFLFGTRQERGKWELFSGVDD